MSRSARATAGVPIRRRLLLLAGVAIVPVAITSAIGLYALASQQRVLAERVGVEFARAVATAVDAELRRAMSVLDSLAANPTLDRLDLPGFAERARRVLETQPDWSSVILADRSGNPLFDTRSGPGVSPPPVVDRPSFDRVVRTGSPAVGDLTRGPGSEALFAVRVPVERDGELRYVLTALARPEGIRAVVTRQRVPADWVISIFDGNGHRVARSRAHEETLGGSASATLRELMAKGGHEASDVTYTLEGERIYTSYSRMEPSGWSAALGIPASLVEAAGYRSLAAYGGGVLLSIAVGALAAVWVARSINRPIADLRAAAQALGERQPLALPETSIQELCDVAAALASAADEIASGEAHRDQLLRKERDARAAAEAADRAKDQFLAVLSHELRTPLNAVYGWARMLRTGQIDGKEQVARALEVIERNANAQVQLIDDLLDVSRVITGKMRLDVRAVHLPAVVESALDAVRPAAEAKGIRLLSVLDPRAGPITGDPDRLQQVVWNLLINAVKFTPKGGRVQVQLQRINSHVEIVVSDTGQGIPPDVLPIVFERFRQADSSSTRAHTGLGLGLALVKHLAELHGGAVTAQSAGEGQGATFIVALPIAIAEIAAGPIPRVHPTAEIEEPFAGTVPLDGIRVLIVDDDPDSLDIATAILGSAGAVVRTCASAALAVDALRTWRPDVLISDIEMPDEDGYSLIRKVRALDAASGGNTPAVALTAYGRSQDRRLSLAAGYNMHVPKPVDPGELTSIVASLATRPGAPGAPAPTPASPG